MTAKDAEHINTKIIDEAVCNLITTDSDDDVTIDSASKNAEYGSEADDRSSQKQDSDEEQFTKTEVKSKKR